eukprot:1322913-Rhodomonas_salina.2
MLMLLLVIVMVRTKVMMATRMIMVVASAAHQGDPIASVSGRRNPRSTRACSASQSSDQPSLRAHASKIC